MSVLVDLLMVALVLLNLRLVGTSRLGACIQTVAIQAVVLAAAALLINRTDLGPRILAIVALSLAIRAVLLPRLLHRAARQAGVSREVEPLVGFSLSMLIAMGLLAVCFLIAAPLSRSALPSGLPPGSPEAAAGLAHWGRLLVPAALFTTACGLFVIVTRTKAVTQVVGYLAMENGIYAFGVAFAVREPLLVEMGVLLDVLVAVLVMGITIYHISREFDHIDTDRLTTLKD